MKIVPRSPTGSFPYSHVDSLHTVWLVYEKPSFDKICFPLPNIQPGSGYNTINNVMFVNNTIKLSLTIFLEPQGKFVMIRTERMYTAMYSGIGSHHRWVRTERRMFLTVLLCIWVNSNEWGLADESAGLQWDS